MKRLAVILLVLAACSQSTAEEPAPFSQQHDTRFDQPTRLVVNDGTVWVVEKAGRVVSLDGVELINLNFDLTDAHLAQGLLGVEFGSDGRYWLYVAEPRGQGSAVYEMSTGAQTLDDGVLLRQWVGRDHHGGHIAIHDGWLYVSVGDGGWGSEDIRTMTAQASFPERGAVYRWSIDPNHDVWETVARGLRNPYTWAIDEDTIYIGDVGQGRWEELNRAGLDDDANFGWPVFEGADCQQDEGICNNTDNTPPAIDYSHNRRCAILVGGILTDGEHAGGLAHTDFCGGFLEVAWFDDEGVTETRTWPGEQFGFVTAIAVDGGTVWLASMDGNIFELTP